MNKVRNHMTYLENSELWDLFGEMQILEETGISADDSKIRKIANEYTDNNVFSMIIVGHEVWRELALRGASYTM